MSEAFIGEIRVFAGNFAPKGWALCNGQIMSIAQNTALFSILGVTYGGDGKTTFALPNLQGRAPVQPGSGPGLTSRTLGEQGGTATVTLLTTEMPAHNHVPQGYDGGATTANADGSVWSKTAGGRTPPPFYSTGAPNVSMSPQAIGVAGGSQPHNNMQPYVGVNFIIALQGIFPSRG